MNNDMQFLRKNMDRYHQVIKSFPGIVLKYFPDGNAWMSLLVVCPLSPKRDRKMFRMFDGTFKKDPKKAFGIMFSMLTDHLLAASFRLGLPQVMISRVSEDRRMARKFTNPEYKSEYAMKTRVGVSALIDAILEKSVLDLDGCR